MTARSLKDKDKMLPSHEQTDSRHPALQFLTDYLSNSNPLLLVFHLFYIIMVCLTLSTSYVLAFHWSSVVQIYTEAHDIKGFGVNLKNSVDTDNKLNILLHEILDQTDGYRAYIYRYHNGLAAISSVPFFFQSNTHEVIAPGATRLLPYEQRIPASFNILVNNRFVKNQCAMITNGDADRDSQNYYYFQSRGAKAFIRCPIYMENGDLFGFVGIDYQNNPKDLKKIDEIVNGAAKRMGLLFATSKK